MSAQPTLPFGCDKCLTKGEPSPQKLRSAQNLRTLVE